MSARQHGLFDLFPPEQDRFDFQKAREEIMDWSRAENTRRAYKYAWLRFSGWCEERERTALPATTETVLDYATWRILNYGSRISTVRTDVAAIRFQHLEAREANPVEARVAELLKNAARKLRERSHGKRALMPDQLRTICERLEAERTPMAVRDHALILFGFSSGWRRSEIASLNVLDISFDGERMNIQLGASKTDQAGQRGREVSIPAGQREATCPVAAMKRWLALRGAWQGPLFCRFDSSNRIQKKAIDGYTVNHRLKVRLTEIGENAARFGAHSLRAGMITSAAAQGADPMYIMQRTGQRSLVTVMRYLRPVEAIRVDPLAGVL